MTQLGILQTVKFLFFCFTLHCFLVSHRDDFKNKGKIFLFFTFLIIKILYINFLYKLCPNIMQEGVRSCDKEKTLAQFCFIVQVIVLRELILKVRKGLNCRTR